jgi:hypothetical protein
MWFQLRQKLLIAAAGGVGGVGGGGGGGGEGGGGGAGGRGGEGGRGGGCSMGVFDRLAYANDFARMLRTAADVAASSSSSSSSLSSHPLLLSSLPYHFISAAVCKDDA